MGFIVICGKIAAVVGESKYTTREEYLHRIQTPVSIEQKCLMEEGNVVESYARKYYEKITGLKVYVPHTYIAAKFNKDLGGRADGLIGIDGGVEFKVTGCFEEDEMNPDHYYQILGYMAIYNRKWWDYVVIDNKRMKIHIKRILWDQKKWEETYEKILIFIQEYKQLHVK